MISVPKYLLRWMYVRFYDIHILTITLIEITDSLSIFVSAGSFLGELFEKIVIFIIFSIYNIK